MNMPEGGSERKNCPPVGRTDSEYDVVDAEFAEVDGDSHATDNFESVEPSLSQRAPEDKGALARYPHSAYRCVRLQSVCSD